MTWKKLAFTDEMLTNPLTGNLDMDGNAIIKSSNIYATDSTSDINIVAHNTLSRCPRLSLYGTTYANAGDRGTFQFFTPGAGGISQILAMAVGGLTDSPLVYVYFGLDMNGKKIDNIGDVQANAAAGIVIREYGGNDIGAMAVSGNNDYTMRLKNTDGNNAVDLAGTTYAMIAHYPINMNQKEIDAMVFKNLATAPHAASEVQGEVYYDTADDHLHVWVV